MLTVIMEAYFNIFIMFPNISMMYTILVYLNVGLFSHSYGICIKKTLMAIIGKEFHQTSNKRWVIVHATYVNIIIVALMA